MAAQEWGLERRAIDQRPGGRCSGPSVGRGRKPLGPHGAAELSWFTEARGFPLPPVHLVQPPSKGGGGCSRKGLWVHRGSCGSVSPLTSQLQRCELRTDCWAEACPGTGVSLPMAMEEEENPPPPAPEDPVGGSEEQGRPSDAPPDREPRQPGALCTGQVIMLVRSTTLHCPEGTGGLGLHSSSWGAQPLLNGMWGSQHALLSQALGTTGPSMHCSLGPWELQVPAYTAPSHSLSLRPPRTICSSKHCSSRSVSLRPQGTMGPSMHNSSCCVPKALGTICPSMHCSLMLTVPNALGTTGPSMHVFLVFNVPKALGTV
nr:uncharacterized protein LOC102445256 [Pelodiscus sinensis]|eukprot:XP_006130916.1 uncharacterized protein LOC102445256 [Pelodiscus sinensis]